MGMNIGREAMSGLLAFGILGYSSVKASAIEVEAITMPTESKQAALKGSMRNLWAEHVIWTRAFLMSEIGGTPDSADVAARLLKNQADIGEAFADYYGKYSGAKLAELLRRHIYIAAEVVDAAKSGDDAQFKDSDERWHENANDIAVFLSEANPNWSKKEIVGMFNEHLALTTKEAASRLNKKWPDDIAAFDEIFRQMMVMADDLSNGIIKQFPEKFVDTTTSR